VTLNRSSPLFFGATELTNNVGELTAIGMALTWLIYITPLNPHLTKALIYTDSSYALGAITGTKTCRTNLGVVLACTKVLKTLRATHQITIDKVRAHVATGGSANNYWNKTADQLAKQAWTGSSFNTFFLDIPVLGPRPVLQEASPLSPPMAAHPFSIPQRLFYSNLLPIIGISADSLLALSIITADLLLPVLEYIRLLKTSSPPQNDEVILLQMQTYLQHSGMTAFQFLRATGSRASYVRRFYETNPNGCCGVIAPYQCRQRDHIDPTSSLRNLVRPISFHDSQERESFLHYIDHLISTSTSPEATSCLSNMRGWILSNFRPGMDNTITPQLDSSGWWKAEWLSSVDLDTRFTYFCNSPTIPHHKLSDAKKHNYLIAYLSSSTRAQYLFSLDDIK